MKRLLLAVALVLSSVAGAQPATIILVRHAEKASQTETDPVLSAAGTQRAKDLGVALVDANVSSVFVTQYQRTRLTAADVIAARSLTPIVINAGAPTHPSDVAAEVMKRPAGEVVLVVGHSNTVNQILAALGGPKMGNICDSQYSNMVIVRPRAGSAPDVIRAKFGAADPADPACANTMR